MLLERHSVRRRFAVISGTTGMFRRGIVALATLLVLTLLPTAARAAVPMCSEDGRTVAAPPIILPWRKLTLDAPKQCQQQENPLLRAMPDRQQNAPSSPPAPAPLRAMPARPVDVAPPAGIREHIANASSPPGFHLVASIYRPPRA
jgi:hypothetical protein